MTRGLRVWTDGACRGNGYDDAIGAAVAMFSWPLGRRKRRILPRYSDPRPTSQRAELTGIVLALETALSAKQRGGKKGRFYELIVNTDSRYAVGCMVDWLEGWKDRGWINSRGLPVANRDLIIEASDLVDELEDEYSCSVYFNWIPREENTRADEFVKEVLDEADYDSD
ncbi:unnamed protein product [Mycena citricolor]|uniref:RNase H type-1 domain-containing protein n=1 Tax=Mycena citricolor TaxID=2018698 RepID=A0AAD2HAC7_9AGAR|nr:unnamed protein product [Mycena citricolor]